MNTTLRIITFALAGALAGGMTACATEPVQSTTASEEEMTVTPTDEVSAVPSASESSPSVADQVDAAPAPVAEVPDVLAFGTTAVYSDVEFAVGVPEPYEPSEYAAGDDLASNVKINVAITNTGTGLFDPSSFYLTATSGGQPTSQVFDTDIESAPSTKILPGQSVTWPIVLSVADPAAIVVEAQVDFEHESAVYTNVAL